jgi:hypothetical protein
MARDAPNDPMPYVGFDWPATALAAFDLLIRSRDPRLLRVTIIMTMIKRTQTTAMTIPAIDPDGNTLSVDAKGVVVVAVSDVAVNVVVVVVESHSSRTKDDSDIEVFTRPDGHVVHAGCFRVDPAVAVNVPAAHLVWGKHKSVDVDKLDIEDLNCPGLHGVHAGCASVDPAYKVYVPAAHLV